MMYHTYDKVRIVANNHLHGFRIGDVVTIQNSEYSGSLHYWAGKDGDYWPEEIVPVAPVKMVVV